MARLLTCGFEVNSPGTFTLVGEDSGIAAVGGVNGTQAFVTSPVRSGKYALRLVNATSNDNKWGWTFTGVLSRVYYMRVCFQIGAFGNGNTWPLNLFGSTDNLGVEVMVTSSGVLTMAYASTDQTVVTGPTVTTGQWYVAQVAYIPGGGTIPGDATNHNAHLWVDGTDYGSGTCQTTANTSMKFAWGAVSNFVSTTWYFDDLAINDDQGSAQNGRCGLGNVVLLKPVSDSTATGFVAGAGGTSSLSNAVDNTPPLGVVQTSATNTSQIKDNTSNTTDNYQANMGAYTTAITSGGGGLGSSDNVVLVQGLVNHSNSSTTSRTNGAQVVSNPAIVETTGTTGATAAGTFPTGWTTLKTAVSYSPSVSLGASPVMEFRKGTASTDYSMCDLMGMYVEYTPGVPSSAKGQFLTWPQAMWRSASR